jgi:hypothetical protein
MTNAYYVKVISATKIAVYEDAEFTRPASFNFDDFSGVPLITKIQNSSLGITYDSFFVNPVSSVSTGILLTYTYYAGSIGTFIVPDNVSTITVTVVGAGGGSGGNYQNATTLGSATSGTAGSIVLGDLNVQGGQVLTIYPGIGGSRGLQSWNGGVGGTGGVNYFPAYSGSAGVTSNGGSGGGGAASVIVSNSSVLVLAAGGSGGAGGTGTAGGAGGGVNVVPAGLNTSTSTNGGAAGMFAAYYAASYGTGGAAALSAVNSALTGVPNYSGAFTGIPTNNGNGTDFIISATLKSGSGGYTTYRTQAQQGAAFYGPGSALNIYAGRTVTGVNTSGNGGSSFWLSGPDTYSDGSDGYVVISIVNSRHNFYLDTQVSTTGVTITPASLGIAYVPGRTSLFYVVNTGVTINAASTATSALLIYGFNSGDTITIENYGTIAGVGGAGGRNNSGGYFEENGNVDGLGYGGDVPNNPYGQNGPAVGGSPGSAGGPAIGVISTAYYTRINVYNYNYIFGGGGGAGGGGGNNSGGGSAGNGGIAIAVTGSSNVVLYNQQPNSFIGGGGGGGSGWGNRSAGSTEGGAPGQDGFITSNGGGNFGAQGVAGAVITGGAVKSYTGPQTVTLS